MLKKLLVLFLFSSIYSCVKSQNDKVLFEDTLFKVKVFQSDLDKYIFDKQVKDTVGKTHEFVTILSNAKFRLANRIAGSQSVKLSYEEAIKQAEEFINRKNLVNKVLVVKHERKMYLLKNGAVVKIFPINLGPNPVGQKEFEGDGKTPEGIYSLDWQKWNSSTFHSFHISYPNKTDSVRAIKKRLIPGSNIMIHGTSNGKKKKDWTNGCIALTNRDMTKFKEIVFQETPIEIIK